MNIAKFNHKIREIRDDRARGASELARCCLMVLAQAARELPADSVTEWRRGLLRLSAELADSRPSMTPVRNLLGCWQAEMSGETVLDLAAARQAAAERAEELIARSQQAARTSAVHAAQLLGAGRTLMTHSLSSTVLETCRLLKDRGLRMIITESRPLEEGRRLARQLSAWKVATTYITEAQMALFVARADAVLVGADSVLADGSVVNKAGTYLLGLAAREQRVPFYVCCESFKWRKLGEALPELEEMAPSELKLPDWPAVTVRNVYFDITPARLVSAWIDETGARWPNVRP